MPDFILNTFHKLLATLKEHHYTFQTFAGFLKEPAKKVIILRHDVDARKMNSLKTAQIENELGISGTYYFRMIPQSFDEEVIKQIACLGHEIGYHYEDISRCAVRGMRQAEGSERPQDRKTARPQVIILPEAELADIAIISFRENLAKLRKVVPVKTICMHGSPLSKYDNRMLWEKFNYRDYGIIGEPYFDINFDEVLYLTDTGRRWDGDLVNIRDKATGDRRQASGKEGRRDEETERLRDKEQSATSNQQLGRALKNSPMGYFREGARLQGRMNPFEPIYHFHSTFDIICAAESRTLPDKIMLTIHPQRWDSRPISWIRELIWQNIKNVGKKIITDKQKRDL